MIVMPISMFNSGIGGFPSIGQAAQSDLYILIAAFSFGMGFVVQRAAMIGGIGPMTFNACRFVLSAVILGTAAPLFPVRPKLKNEGGDSGGGSEHTGLLELGSVDKAQLPALPPGSTCSESNLIWAFGIALGILNFVASSLQEVGLQYTSAGKCAFITGLDVVIVPLICLLIPFLDNDMKAHTWVAIAISLAGMYLISTSEMEDQETTFSRGDVFCMVGAVFWAIHIVTTEIATSYVDAVNLTMVQFLSVGVLCLISSYALEYNEWSLSHLMNSWEAILLLAVCECVGLTMVAVAQAHLPASRTAIIMSFEAGFAAILGFIFLRETLSGREVFGCLLMVLSFLCIKIDLFADIVKRIIHRYCGRLLYSQ
jgi:drug/metabolite transporter (DMT)-like permease